MPLVLLVPLMPWVSAFGVFGAFAAFGVEKCKPYCGFGLRGTKNKTPTAVSAPQDPKMQPLFRFRAPRGEKCDPYNVLGP